MPTYEYKDVNTGKISEIFLKLADKDQFQQDNPNLEQIIGAPSMITRRDGDVLKKAGAGWNEVLQKVGEHYPDSDVAKKNVRRTAKQVKTDEIIKKHAVLQNKEKQK
jgi:hypothetical protein